MEAKELMIGDWVYVTKNFTQKYHKIRALSNDEGAVLRGIYVNEYGVKSPSIFSPNDTEPIPLTQEILEKNGFEVTRNMSSSGNKNVWSLRVSKNKVFHIIEHHNKRKFPYFWIELGSNSDIKYVHQLQHALRLCGVEKTIEL